jgi:hypothetical protein
LPVLLVILIGLSLGVGGCVSGVYGHPALVSGDVPSAELVVLREKGMALGAFAVLVRLDGEKLGKLRAGRYAQFRVRPGVYQLTMDDPQNLARIDAAVLDPLRLSADTRTYLLLGKHSESWGVSTQAQYCVHGSCPQIGQPSTSVSVSFVFGFDLISEKEAQALMGEYKQVGSE